LDRDCEILLAVVASDRRTLVGRVVHGLAGLGERSAALAALISSSALRDAPELAPYLADEGDERRLIASLVEEKSAPRRSAALRSMTARGPARYLPALERALSENLGCGILECCGNIAIAAADVICGIGSTDAFAALLRAY
jgi:hypothetical protein